MLTRFVRWLERKGWVEKELEIFLPTLVVTANMKQFEFYKKENKWDKRYYIYFGGASTVLGRRYRDIIFVGEWWLNMHMNKFRPEELKIYLRIK